MRIESSIRSPTVTFRCRCFAARRKYFDERNPQLKCPLKTGRKIQLGLSGSVDPGVGLGPWNYIGGVRVCFDSAKMSHSFILNSLDNSASFTSSRIKDLCQKWKVKLIFRGAWNSGLTSLTLTPYFTTDLCHWSESCCLYCGCPKSVALVRCMNAGLGHMCTCIRQPLYLINVDYM